MAKWDYGGAYLRHPVQGKRVVFTDGSMAQEHDIFAPLPGFMGQADLIFVDPPWNIGNLRSFYTKAGRTMDVDWFDFFYKTLFKRIMGINPHTCYVEVGKEFLGEFLLEMKKGFRSVTFFNSYYYRRKENKCYVVRGSTKRKKLGLDDMDEAEIISWVCSNEDYNCIGDLCMGRGLVGLSAFAAGKKFAGTELNHKRLSVMVEKLSAKGLNYKRF